MYLRRFKIENVRSIDEFEMEFDRGAEAGWHVILGTNGSGKSSVIRSFALLAMGEKEAYASRQDFSRWIRQGVSEAVIHGVFTMNEEFDGLVGGGKPPSKAIITEVRLNQVSTVRGTAVEVNYSGERILRTIWGGGVGWFTASFGPFRRFTGGDRIYDRLFVSNKRLAPHLTALGEDVALTEALGWLTALHVQNLQDERAGGGNTSIAGHTLSLVIRFINDSGFFPHSAKIYEITNDTVIVRDGNGLDVSIDQLSDGYRSALSLSLELVRQMFEVYGHDVMARVMFNNSAAIIAPGIVAIDEIDAHLHPTWQRDIGRWLRKSFPQVQFLVTTHSPIVCRSVASDDGAISGSVWRLPVPGTGQKFERVTGVDLDQLVYGDILDAFGTELFGRDISISAAGEHKRERLAELNTLALQRSLDENEFRERRNLRMVFPAESGVVSKDANATINQDRVA